MRIILSILFVLMTASCQNVERTEKPDDLIPEDKMVDVLTEISLLHAARNYNKRMLEETGLDPENYIWEKYDIDSLQFANSSDYYSENYDKYEVVYTQVRARLEGYRDIYDSLRETEERVKDSLRGEEVDTTRAREIRRIPDSMEVERSEQEIRPREVFKRAPGTTDEQMESVRRDTIW